jgi:hypothetical protein
MGILNLSSPVSKEHRLEEEDVIKTKIGLHNAGYYDPPKEYGLTPYSDEAMLDGMKRF